MHELSLWAKDIRLMLKRMVLFATTMPKNSNERNAWLFIMAIWVLGLTIMLSGILRHLYSY